MSVGPKRVLFVATVVKTHIMTFHIPALKMFKEMGYETAVAARNDYENPEDCQIPYCDQFFDIPFQREPFNYDNFQCYKKLKSIIDEGEFSIVYCHTPVGGVLGRLAARNLAKKDVRTVYMAHGFHFYKGAPIRNWLLYYPVEKLCSYFTDILITINKEDYNLAKKKMKAKAVEYLPGVGIDSEKFGKAVEEKNSIREELGIPKEDLMMLSVGEVNENKNHKTVIRALSLCETKNIHYVIAGQGPCVEEHLSLARQCDVADRVHFVGYRKDIHELLKESDMFVFPSYREGLSLALTEAMVCGLPVVASKIRGNTDLIDDELGGFLCEPTDAKSMAMYIDRLSEDIGLRLKMGAYNHEKSKKYDSNVIVNKLITMILGQTKTNDTNIKSEKIQFESKRKETVGIKIDV